MPPGFPFVWQCGKCLIVKWIARVNNDFIIVIVIIITAWLQSVGLANLCANKSLSNSDHFETTKNFWEEIMIWTKFPSLISYWQTWAFFICLKRSCEFFLFTCKSERVKYKWNNLSSHLNNIFSQAPLSLWNLMVFRLKEIFNPCSLLFWVYNSLVSWAKVRSEQREFSHIEWCTFPHRLYTACIKSGPSTSCKYVCNKTKCIVTRLK